MRVGPMTPSVPMTWPFDLVGRGDDAALVERDQARLAADVDLHALRALRHVEQVQQRCLLLEQVEQPAQPLHVRREILALSRLRSPVTTSASPSRERAFARIDGRLHQAGDILAQRAKLVGQALADRHRATAGESAG